VQAGVTVQSFHADLANETLAFLRPDVDGFALLQVAPLPRMDLSAASLSRPAAIRIPAEKLPERNQSEFAAGPEGLALHWNPLLAAPTINA